MYRHRDSGDERETQKYAAFKPSTIEEFHGIVDAFINIRLRTHEHIGSVPIAEVGLLGKQQALELRRVAGGEG